MNETPAAVKYVLQENATAHRPKSFLVSIKVASQEVQHQYAALHLLLKAAIEINSQSFASNDVNDHQIRSKINQYF